MSQAPIQLNESLKHAMAMPLRLQIAALGEGLIVGQGVECQHFALRLIEIAGYSSRRFKRGPDGKIERALGPVELFSGLSGYWRARYANTALRALAMGWESIDRSQRTLALALGRSRWIAVVNEMSVDEDAKVRYNALRIARDTVDPGFGVMVCSMLGDEDQKVRLGADRALIRLVLEMFDHLPAESLGEDLDLIRRRAKTPMIGSGAILELERCAMLNAIADAAWSFATHRCRSPLLASLLLMDRRGATPVEQRAFEKMRRLLRERNHPSHMPMRTVLRSTPAPILRERALRWLVVEPIASVAATRLGIAETTAEHTVVLDQMHLAIRPVRAKGLRRVRVDTRQQSGVVVAQPEAPLLDEGVFAGLEPKAKRGYIRWITGLDLDGGLLRKELEQAMADQDDLVRLHACCVAGSHDLVDYLYDSSEVVARSAALRWSSLGSRAPMVGSPSWTRRMETARLNTRSATAWVRRVSHEEIDRLSIDQPASPASRLAARRMHQADPAKFVRAVRKMLQDPARRGQGLGMILSLGLENRFEMDLVSLTMERSIEPRIGASLVRGLDRIGSEAAKRAVLQSLESDDQRIVANAIESVHTPIESLVEYKGDSHHRVRSSAIRRMLVSGSRERSDVVAIAAEDLGEMLNDSRVSHRLAGVWAAQRAVDPSIRSQVGLRWRELVMKLNEMSQSEPDDQVRSRADRCVHRMLVTQRSVQQEVGQL